MKEVEIIIDGERVVFEVPTTTTLQQLIDAVEKGVEIIGGRRKKYS